MRSLIALVACVASLGLVNYSIFAKERLLATGAVVLLELAPVDPRSLMQGDYMALRFRMANDARSEARGSPPRESSGGRLVATLDERGVASYRRLHDGKPVASNEVLLRYRVRNGEIKFATNAFFFQEGTAERYQGARYGEFRVAPDGELLLTGLRDKDLKPL
jgi:uncharacterized membrane-anchored protein